MGFNNMSVIDSRYAEECETLKPYFTEEANIAYLIKIESAILKEHMKLRGFENNDFDFSSIKALQVYSEEKKTHHQLRALVNLMQSKIPDRFAKFIHWGVTSSDVQDTANVLRIRDAVNEVILPEFKILIQSLIDKTQQYRNVKQIGRTHGQWAIPITFGWALAEYVQRLGDSYFRISGSVCDLRGQISGAVGTYDALSYIVPDPIEFEKRVLGSLGLRPSEYSSQIINPDIMPRFFAEFNIAFGALANLADDLRNLQRSEIGEIKEEFTADQVGSSTMPQKRNPCNSEHVKSLWKEFMPRYMTFCLDQISDHQRDLTNSASSRFVTEYLVGFYLAVKRMNKILKGLVIDEFNMSKHMKEADSSSAEKAYILLQKYGYSDAHEKIRRITIKADIDQITFTQALKNSGYWDRIKDNWEMPHRDWFQDKIDSICNRVIKYLTEN